MRWLVYGRWPSDNDLDLMLDADEDTYTAIKRGTGADRTFQYVQLDGGVRYVGRDELCLPDDLIAEAIQAANGLTLDIALIPSDEWTLKGLSVPPYETWLVFWGASDSTIFDRATPLSMISTDKTIVDEKGRAMSETIVQVDVDRDGSGRATVTIRLVEWSMKDLRSLAGSLLGDRESQRIGRDLAKHLEWEGMVLLPQRERWKS